jgi:hypothetical protein
MTVQLAMCAWPTCFQTTALQWLVGNTGELWPHCPFHHQWVLRIIDENASAHMPVTERVDPPHLVELFHKEHGKYPWLVFCEEPNCWYRHAAKTKEEGEASLAKHPCPYATPSRGFLVPISAVGKMWEKYDAAIAELMEGNYPPVTIADPVSDDDAGQHEVENPEKVRLKGVCRGMAEMLAEVMSPHFKTPDEIVGEGVRRYKAKKAGEQYETPGLGGLAFAKQRSLEWKEGVNKAGGTPVKSATPAQTKINPLDKFKPEEIKAIKAAKDMGMMDEAQLAKMYKVTEAVIKAVLES